MSTNIEGPRTTQQLRAQGLDPTELARLVECGILRRVHLGVYCPDAAEDTLALRARCASLVLPPHCVVVDRSAAWLHGVDVHDPDERFVVPDLEVVSLRGHAAVRRDRVYAGKRDLTTRDIMEVDGVRVTTPLRTALDLACLRSEHRALATLDAFMRHHGLTHENYRDELTRFKRRRGVVQLRRLVPLASPKAASPGESWLRCTMLRAGFPPPVLQFPVSIDGRLFAELDHAYPERKIAVEYDGEEFHGPDQAEHDAERRRKLGELGWHNIVVRKHQLRGQARDVWLGDLARVFSERTKGPHRRTYPMGQPFEQ